MSAHTLQRCCEAVLGKSPPRSVTSSPVDFVLIDGWPRDHGPSLAHEVIEIAAPQLRSRGYVMNDNAEPDFLEFVRDPKNGFLSITLPLKGGTELCLKVA
jgi:hypothetical protein